MQIFNHNITILLILLHLLPLFLLHYSMATQEKKTVLVQQGTDHVTTNLSSTHAPWLWRISHPRRMGCWRRPLICRRDDSPRIRMRCCRNRCVDVFSDPNNCGLCRIRCPFTWQCCRGICVNTNMNPFNCGKCGRRCPRRSLCSYGMCGYAQPLPPFPFPFPFPPQPRPPHHSPKPYPLSVA